MGTRIEVVNAFNYSSIASAILQAAWTPPCLHYSIEHLAWEFSFPSELPTHGAIAFLDDRPVGWIAVTARQFRYSHTTFPGYVISFLAVDPSAGRRGLGAGLYAALLEAIPHDIPVLGFAEPGGVGERFLLDSFARANFRDHAMRVCRAVGYLGSSTTSNPTERVIVCEAGSYQDFELAQGTSRDVVTVWTHATLKQWEHYRADPRGRVMVTVHDTNHSPLGTAMIVSAELISSQGLQRVPMLASVALANPTPDALAALFRFAASRSQPGSTVIASNVSHIDNAIVRASGARILPSSFNAHLLVKGSAHIVEQASALNIEVI